MGTPGRQRSAFQPRVIAAGVLGTTVEWYDFALYATAASLVFNKLYFPGGDPLVGTIAAFGTFAIGFLGRPLGGAYFGELGDRKGRKHVLVLTLLLMGIATTGIGLLPTYEAIGFAAPFLLTLLRFVQGFAAGGEKTGALVLMFETAPTRSRGLLASLPAIGTGAGSLFSTGAMALASTTLSEQAFLDWGWRVPFLFSAVLTLFGLWVRRSLEEPEEFRRELRRQAAERGAGPESPRPSWRERLAQSRFVESWRKYPKEMIIVICAGAAENCGYYVFGTFSVAYAEDAGLSTGPVLTGVMFVSAVKLVSVPLFGALSDRWGRRPVSILGAAVMAIACYPFFLMVDTEIAWLVWLALLITLGIGQSAVLGSQPAFFAELFTTKVRFTAVGVANNIGTVLTGGLAPVVASALLLWFDHNIIGVVIFLLATCAITVVTVAVARETRETDVLARSSAERAIN
ncbi:MFS transporter [Saccharopolyspora hirsuta]|nr:MFS transporter [Saccharopolyspora hirsuta]